MLYLLLDKYHHSRERYLSPTVGGQMNSGTVALEDVETFAMQLSPLQKVRRVERMLSHLARRADVEVTPHTLRHTFAKNLVNSGVSLEKSRRAHGTQQPQHHQHLHHTQRVGSRARRRPDRRMTCGPSATIACSSR